MAIIGENIKAACQELNRGNLVGIPTETVYGLAGNAYDSRVIAKIFEVKKRPSFDPLIIHIPSVDYLDILVSELPATALKLAEHFWPGPLTLVLPKTNRVPDLATSGLPTVALRIPSHPLTLELLENLDFPLASPSANPFGYISPTTAGHVQDQLGDSIPYILDGGPCSIGIESTIVGFEGEQAVLYRPGGVPAADIRIIVGDLKKKTSGAIALAPGMLKSHYAPGKKLILGSIPELIKSYGARDAAVLSFDKPFDVISKHRQLQLSPDGNLNEAAQNLFACLRKLDAMNIKYIFAEPVPDHGLGIAINDRLRRASAED